MARRTKKRLGKDTKHMAVFIKTYIHTVPRWRKVMEEGPSEVFFHVDNN